MLSEEQVRHIAKLARIDLKDEEVKKFSSQLSDVFGYVEILNEIDTDGVPETSQVTGLKNVLEKDEVRRSLCSREELLSCTELPVDDDQIRVLRAIK
jgi:aspartyl-tRNA(Asn)/glutamyl-tRNA(Gln) amidotransferase subunit C